MPEMPDWITPALAYIPRWLEHQIRVHDQPGCVVAVAYRGVVVLEHAVGLADQERGEALTPRHRFRVASHSKTFTAAGLMTLREQGRVTLEDRASQHVSGLHPDLASATVAQLLSHTAGIFRDGEDAGFWSERAPFPDDAALEHDLSQPAAIAPVLRLKYSNHGFALAGRVIEAITGERWADWTVREIVAAAGLTETVPDVPLAEDWPLARGHSGKLPLGRRMVFPGDQSTRAFAPATGFVATAGDLAKFFAQLSPEAETSILTVTSRREMSRTQWRDPHAALDMGYGLGTMSGKLDGWDWFGHAGGFPGYITRTVTVPAQHLTVSVLTNCGEGLAHPWLDGAVRILKAFADAGVPAPDLADWTGRWWGMGSTVDLVPMGRKVLAAMPAMFDPFGKDTEIDITGPDTGRISQASAFGSYGEPAQLLRDDAGVVTAVRLAGSRLVPEAVLVAEMQARYGGSR